MGTAHLKKYPKKLGILIPEDSEIDLTIKFGALPMYVFAPIKTAPAEIASMSLECHSLTLADLHLLY